MNRSFLVATLAVSTALFSVSAKPTATAPTTSAQQQPTFRSGTRTVPVYATVMDDDGRLVTDLEQADFEIYDNGKKQDITIFDNQTVPFSAVLTLDSSISMTMNLSRVQDAAVQFVTRMLPVDQGMICYFNSKIQFSPELTSNRDSLISHIRNNMQFGNSTRVWDAINSSMDQLAEVPGRRVVVALTDGEDFASNLGNGEVLDRAQLDDVMIYGIGLESNYFNGERQTTSRPGRAFKNMAADTGGGYFELKESADLNSTFTRVVEELHSQYVLGFSPQALDGKTHKLEVKMVKRGFKARARKNYLAK
ncbi:MAG: VWA domain-containing protein [Acidobacteria bacterium]|jgi:Ca-activated chloride channel homolog|nr:VWA domain-containing protein [Acidobacteriota bacterium]